MFRLQVRKEAGSGHLQKRMRIRLPSLQPAVRPPTVGAVAQSQAPFPLVPGGSCPPSCRTGVDEPAAPLPASAGPLKHGHEVGLSLNDCLFSLYTPGSKLSEAGRMSFCRLLPPN